MYLAELAVCVVLKVVEKIWTHCILAHLFPKIVPLLSNMEKYGTTRQAGRMV